MLTLLTFAPGFDDPSHSPFCVKAMCLLQLSGQAWQREDIRDPAILHSMPYGKLPVLRVGDDLIADSELIQTWLESHGADFYPGVDARGRAMGQAMIRMVEENLRVGMAGDRWLDEACWPHMRRELFGPMPDDIVDPLRAGVRQGLMGQGLARMREADRLTKLRRDLAAITTLLDGAFLLGDAPTAADAAVVPVLSMIANLPADTPLRAMVRDDATLMRYIERGRAAMYP